MKEISHYDPGDIVANNDGNEENQKKSLER